MGETDDEGKIVLFDPVNNRNFRLSRSTYQVLEAFDGVRTVPEVMSLLEKQGRNVDAQALEGILGRAQRLGIFEHDDDDDVLESPHLRGPSRNNPLFFKVFEVDPHKLLRPFAPAGSWFFRPITVIIVIALTCVALIAISRQPDTYVAGLYAFTQPLAWVGAYALTVGLTVLHEAGHAQAVMRYGGECRRMGLAVYLLMPAAYADTSAAYRFPKLRQRLVVSSAGVYVEVLVLSVLALLWASHILPGAVSSSVFIVMHVGIARVVANLNPFLRLDGYWILTDLVRISNLRPKSFTYLISRLSPLRADREMARVARSTDEKLFFLVYSSVSLLSMVAAITLVLVFISQALARALLVDTAWIAGPISTLIFLAVSFGSVRYVGSLRQEYHFKKDY